MNKTNLEKKIEEENSSEGAKMALIPFYCFKYLIDNPQYRRRESYILAGLIELGKISNVGLFTYSIYKILT